MLSIIQIIFQRIEYNRQVFFIIQKISIRNINKNCFDIVVLYIARVRLLYIEQILIQNILFIVTISFFYILAEFVNRWVQVNKDIGKYNLLLKNIK